MSVSHLITLLFCILIIALNGRFNQSLRNIVGVWRFAISIPLSLFSVYLVYLDTPLLLPITIVILLMLLSANYLKYKV
ncbi:hypothetical protein [Companilactobacillus sp.]|uniref:hypothetical protein n=1 Tax=Companilactobacillus sp. TaxID=2767905 RepID=UPI0025C53785|nr:hypothetical protein [Companilactobacillus sp.]MCH4009311.1 hypothetical protein [Companilactobacillus sp.]MCH4050510.1 hypothetical protein [Companilactobacillus sp.]MCH4077253.1 hypothetical protein [Companilactobacillus sp.]MCH4125829.1 hypothetical protein [Companilactobacillus sp.]MCI1311538.1 hypothetical protein [Companilactobacillus sp.]